MNPLTAIAPPAAYWLRVPWPAFVAIVIVICLLWSPWALAWLKGKSSAYTSREQALSKREADINDQRDSALHEAREGERSTQQVLFLARESWNKERVRLEKDRDRGWDLARDMEEIAHQRRHDAVNLVARFNALFKLAQSFASGKVAKERALVLLAEMPPAETPAAVPSLREAVGRKPDGSPAE